MKSKQSARGYISAEHESEWSNDHVPKRANAGSESGERTNQETTADAGPERYEVNDVQQ